MNDGLVLVLSLLLLLVATPLPSQATPPDSSPYGLLLIVGDVQDTSARILIQHVDELKSTPSNIPGTFKIHVFLANLTGETPLSDMKTTTVTVDSIKKLEEEGMMRKVETRKVQSLGNIPSVVSLPVGSLLPATQYLVTFEFHPDDHYCDSAGAGAGAGGADLICHEKHYHDSSKDSSHPVDFVLFRTFAPWQVDLYLAVVSCNRYYEDMDVEFVKSYLAPNVHRRHGTVHIGGSS